MNSPLENREVRLRGLLVPRAERMLPAVSAQADSVKW
jgi:hypothetical protein